MLPLGAGSTWNPLSLHFMGASSGGPPSIAGCDLFFGGNIFDLEITLAGGAGSSSGPYYCCQAFLILGCNNLPLQHAWVTVYDREGGNVLAFGETTTGGVVSLTWSGAYPDTESDDYGYGFGYEYDDYYGYGDEVTTVCDVYITVTKCFFYDYAGNFFFNAGDETSITLTNNVGTCVAGYADPSTTFTLTVMDCSLPPVPCAGAIVWLDGLVVGATDGNGQIVLTAPARMPLKIAGCGGLWVGVVAECGDFTVYLDCNLCEINLTVLGCNSLPLQGAYCVIGGGTPVPGISDGYTDSDGHCTLYVPVDPVSHTVQVSCGRFDTYTSGDISCTAPGSIDLTVNLSPTTDYVCLTCGAIPMHVNAQIFDSYYGNTTPITYNATSGTWVSGTVSQSWPGNSCCVAAGFKMKYTFHPDCTISAAYSALAPSGSYYCPSGLVVNISISGITMTVQTVSAMCDLPNFYFQASITQTVCPQSGDGPFPMIYPLPGAVYIVTEL